MEAGHNPHATIADGPEEDPPVYLSTACGFLGVLVKVNTNLLYLVNALDKSNFMNVH